MRAVAVDYDMTANADWLTVTSLAALAVILTVAVYREMKERRIPNWLTLTGMTTGLLLGYVHGGGAFQSSIVGLAIGFGFLFIFYMFGGIGGGDVKLMGAAGALLGSNLVKPALFFTVLIGAVMAVMALVWSRDFWARLKRSAGAMAFWRKREPLEAVPSAPVTIPYGVAIAAGCLVTLYLRAL